MLVCRDSKNCNCQHHRCNLHFLGLQSSKMIAFVIPSWPDRQKGGISYFKLSDGQRNRALTTNQSVSPAFLRARYLSAAAATNRRLIEQMPHKLRRHLHHRRRRRRRRRPREQRASSCPSVFPFRIGNRDT